jgi:hypothetical protein
MASGRAHHDVAALLSCWRFAPGFPGAVWYGWRMLPVLMDAYDREVAPVVAVIVNPAARVSVDRALRAMSIKIGLSMVNFARLAGCALRVDIAVLAGAVTRLYDDIIDGGDGDGGQDDRLADLIKGLPFTPGSDLEGLLQALGERIRDLLVPDDDVAVEALSALHEYQCLSRGQRDPAVPLPTLEKISRGKGALASLTLFVLVKPRLESAERELIMALGEPFQSLDDYMDVELDLANGIATLVNTGAVTLADIAARLRALRPRLARCYGAGRTRRYYGMIYYVLLRAVLSRRFPFIDQFTLRFAHRSETQVFLTRGTEAVP